MLENSNENCIDNQNIKCLNNTHNKLQTELLNIKNNIKYHIVKIDKLNSKLHLLKQQNEIYSHESNVIIEKIKDSNWALTKDICQKLGRIKKPCTELINLSEKFMIILDQKEKTWKMFQAVMKNHNSLKELMNSFNPENIKDENIDSLLPLWKNYAAIYSKLAKEAKEACILLNWITGCVEYKIKKATLNTVKYSIIEIQAKLENQVTNLADKNALLLLIDSKINDIKGLISDNSNLNDNNKKYNLNAEIKDNDLLVKNLKLYDKNSFSSPDLKLNNEKAKLNNFNTGNINATPTLDEFLPRLTTEDNAENMDKLRINNVVNNVYNFTVKKMSLSNTGQSIFQSKLHNYSYSNANSPKNIAKIHNIIKANEPRNTHEVIVMDSKLMFAKETQQEQHQKRISSDNIELKTETPQRKQSTEESMKFRLAGSQEYDVGKLLLNDQNHYKNQLGFESNITSCATSATGKYHPNKTEEVLQQKSRKSTLMPSEYQNFQEDLKFKIQQEEEEAKINKNYIIEYHSQIHDDSTSVIGCMKQGIKFFC